MLQVKKCNEARASPGTASSIILLLQLQLLAAHPTALKKIRSEVSAKRGSNGSSISSKSSCRSTISLSARVALNGVEEACMGLKGQSAERSSLRDPVAGGSMHKSPYEHTTSSSCIQFRHQPHPPTYASSCVSSPSQESLLQLRR